MANFKGNFAQEEINVGAGPSGNRKRWTVDDETYQRELSTKRPNCWPRCVINTFVLEFCGVPETPNKKCPPPPKLIRLASCTKRLHKLEKIGLATEHQLKLEYAEKDSMCLPMGTCVLKFASVPDCPDYDSDCDDDTESIYFGLVMDDLLPDYDLIRLCNDPTHFKYESSFCMVAPCPQSYGRKFRSKVKVENLQRRGLYQNYFSLSYLLSTEKGAKQLEKLLLDKVPDESDWESWHSNDEATSYVPPQRLQIITVFGRFIEADNLKYFIVGGSSKMAFLQQFDITVGAASSLPANTQEDSEESDQQSESNEHHEHVRDEAPLLVNTGSDYDTEGKRTLMTICVQSIRDDGTVFEEGQYIAIPRFLLISEGAYGTPVLLPCSPPDNYEDDLPKSRTSVGIFRGEAPAIPASQHLRGRYRQMIPVVKLSFTRGRIPKLIPIDNENISVGEAPQLIPIEELSIRDEVPPLIPIDEHQDVNDGVPELIPIEEFEDDDDEISLHESNEFVEGKKIRIFLEVPYETLSSDCSYTFYFRQHDSSLYPNMHFANYGTYSSIQNHSVVGNVSYEDCFKNTQCDFFSEASNEMKFSTNRVGVVTTISSTPRYESNGVMSHSSNMHNIHQGDNSTTSSDYEQCCAFLTRVNYDSPPFIEENMDSEEFNEEQNNQTGYLLPYEFENEDSIAVENLLQFENNEIDVYQDL